MGQWGEIKKGGLLGRSGPESKRTGRKFGKEFAPAKACSCAHTQEHGAKQGGLLGKSGPESKSTGRKFGVKEKYLLQQKRTGCGQPGLCEDARNGLLRLPDNLGAY